jgi:hypothetical protein
MDQWIINEYDTGDTISYYNGVVESYKDHPAVVSNNGTLLWFSNGKLHRVNGAAVKNINGTQEYWLDGVQYSWAEWWHKRNV